MHVCLRDQLTNAQPQKNEIIIMDNIQKIRKNSITDHL